MSATSEMLSVDQAHEAVFKYAKPLAPTEIEIDQALGSVLATNITSDVDSPPHDKSIVDGYAVQSGDVAEANRELIVLEEVTAGRLPTQTVTAGTCTRIMTGAAIPDGADAVVMFEKTQPLADDRVQILDSEYPTGQNIMRRGASLRMGEVVLAKGQRLRPIDIGLLAEVGQALVPVVRTPQVAILATGDELVPIDTSPGPAQIRNSNGSLLTALVQQAGATPLALGIARDEPTALRESIERGLQADVLLLSGGVSAGVLDLVPAVLRELGVQQVFHRVKVKPGKPLWFGVYETDDRRCLVFGLPGNPLSGLVSCELFVKPALNVLGGGPPALPRLTLATLTQEFRQRGERYAYSPAVLAQGDNGDEVATVRWSGSADMRGFAAANALAIFPPGERIFQRGEKVNVWPLDPNSP